MKYVVITSRGSLATPVALAVRKAMDSVESFTLDQAKRRINARMQTGENDEIKWFNAGLNMAINEICDMEAGR